jgi:hypothetical protein
MQKHEAQMTAKTYPKSAARSLPADLAEVALIDAATSVAPGGLSLSWWHAEVAAGRAPQPAVRMPRCTRWKISDVKAFWIAFAANALADKQAAANVLTKAAKASAAAQVARRAAREIAGAA